MPERNILRSMAIRWRRALNSPKFNLFGERVYLFERVTFSGRELIDIGDDVVIQRDSHLAAGNREVLALESRLVVGSGSNIGPRNHIYAQRCIEIGRKVLTAPNVFISDCTHQFLDPSMAIIDQPLKPLSATIIGNHSWIGHGSVVIGCRVGKHCVIGANSVVISDIPDFSVAVGAPARVVRRFDQELGSWVSHSSESANKGSH